MDIDSRERTDHTTHDKVMPLGEAVRRHIHPGTVLHLAYSDARPNAAVYEIVRQFDGTELDLVVSTAGLVSMQHALVSRGLVSRVITAFAGDNYPAPRPNPLFQNAVRRGAVEVENWSLYSFTARLMGGALGVEFFPVNSLRGSDLATEHSGKQYAEISSPFGTDVTTGVVRSYRPDVVVIQAVAADHDGNAIIAAPHGEAYWGALAAQRAVIVCAEKIVSRETIRDHNTSAVIPGHVVRAVCEVPFGSHPYGLYNSGVAKVSSYTQDEGVLIELQDAAKDQTAFSEWVNEWVIQTADHEDYLRKLGAPRLESLRGKAVADGSDLGAGYGCTDEPSGEGLLVTDTERMVVTAAHAIAERVRERGHHALLAGVGYSNLAAWLASRLLTDTGDRVELLAEIGMYGYDPRPGDPFIFAQHNFPTCAALNDVATVLGALVGGPATQAMGAIGAGQIDQRGRINSTWSGDGLFLVGSGGANDIATSASEVLVTLKHSRSRLVAEVPYVTAPGSRVQTIVTTEGVLERVGREFQLVRYYTKPGESEVQTVKRIRTLTGWPLKVSDRLKRQPEPSPLELDVIRKFDPRRTFLR